MLDRELVAEVAARRLAPDVAQRWLRLARPAAALHHAGPGEPVAAVLGGLPHLPEKAKWPAWEGHGPLSFIGAVDCAALSVPLDIHLPRAGTLLLFYFDGQCDNHAADVGFWDPATLAGARVLYMPPGEQAAPRPCPDGITPYQQVPMAVDQVMTFPGLEHPDLQAVFMAPGTSLREFLDHPVNDEAFVRALEERRPGPCHQVGGYPVPLQGPVEYEAAVAALGGRDPGDGSLAGGQARWTLLAQIDSDQRAGLMWGDCGSLYWLSRREDLADGRFENVSFTWQCA